MDAVTRTAMLLTMADLIERRLEAVRVAISRELSSIPMPVPGCDVNFNRLLEDRAHVVDDLQKLAKLRRDGVLPSAYAEFAKTCPWLDQPTRDQIAHALHS